MSHSPDISVIIPVANEAAALPRCLARIGGTPNETIVVDAQSEDGTAAIARRFGCLLRSFPGRHRARQMNLGAAQACAPILLFLHADTLLPADALPKIRAVLQRPGIVGGGFARRYRSRSLILALTCRLAGLRNRLCGWHLGDQAIFVRRDIFQKLGGFREIPMFEDLDFSRRLRRAGCTVTLTPPVFSSARRFAARGPWRTTLGDFRLTMRYLAGTDPNALCKERANRVERPNL